MTGDVTRAAPAPAAAAAVSGYSRPRFEVDTGFDSRRQHLGPTPLFVSFCSSIEARPNFLKLDHDTFVRNK